MLPKPKRLTRDLFKDLLTHGGFFHTPHFLLRSASFSLGPRLAVSVSKKVAKSSVLRNRTRRRAYAAAGKLLPALNKKLYLVIAKPGAEKLKGEALQNELAELLKKG